MCQAENCPGSCPSFVVSLQPVIEVKNFLPFPARLDIHVSTVFQQYVIINMFRC